uniref:Uncharacterized protein n=1 Tax=Schizaphis graminum TaxID=13262 RepID=A0A2S2PT22_SCHGA
MSRNIDQFIEDLRSFNNKNVRAIQNDLLLPPLLSSGDRSLVSDDDDNEIFMGIMQTELKSSSPKNYLAGANKDQSIKTPVVPIMKSLSTDKSLKIGGKAKW